mmetsp:Transcript_62555/g.134414  ORF Transcript_62555/g.134414 Transcript_62555/m.134414 type:complete len:133 (+) Transcript_62555:82-480(+)
MVLLSAITLAKVNAGFSAYNFTMCYLFPGKSIGQFLPKLEAKNKPLVEYCFTFVGQHDVPWLLMSLLVVKSGTVSKEYMMASIGWWYFVAVDIGCRVCGRAEEHGGDKNTVIPFVPICVIFGLLNVLAYREM